MLGQLPTELLLRVLELAAPLDYDPFFYLSRRHLLLDCSLVSKTLCAVAQPMLREVYKVATETDIAILEVESGGKKRGSSVRVLVVGSNFVNAASINLRYLLGLVPAVVDARLASVGPLDLQCLSRNQALRKLVLHNVLLVLPVSPSDALFPSLVELSLCGTAVDDGFFKTFPTPTTTPVLRALGIAAPEPTTTRALQSSSPPALDLSQALLHQLDILSLDTQDRYLDACVNGRPPASLVLDSNLEEPGLLLDVPTLPSFVRLYLTDDILELDSTQEPVRSVCDALTTLAEQVRRSDPSTRCSVVLRPALGDSLEQSDELKGLVDALRRVGGEVIREEEADWLYESLISPEVWRRMTRRKLEEGGVGRN